MIFDATTSITADQPATISSLEASYEDNVLHLKGDVLLEHALGTMSAEYAELKTPIEGASLSDIVLNGRVRLFLQDGAELECARAELDLHAFNGTLFGEEGRAVSYIKNDSPAMHVQSQRIDALFQKVQDVYSLKQLRAQKGVSVLYAHDYSIGADWAVYEKKEGEETFIFYPLEGQLCSVKYKGDELHGKRIDVDLVKKNIFITDPNATITSLQGLCRIKCEALLVEQLPRSLTLSQHVHVEHALWGTVETEGKMTILSNQLEALGKTKIVYEDRGLTCEGRFILDQDKQVCHLICDPGHKLIYQDKDMRILAERADIQYEKLGNKMQPVHIALTGAVQLQDSRPENARVALADRADCDVKTGLTVLFASSGSPVLFVDTERNMQMSASEVRIIKDPASGIETVQGVGCVRFSLTPQETQLVDFLRN